MRQETLAPQSPPGRPTYLPRRRGRGKRCWGSWRRGRLQHPCCSCHLSWVDTPAAGGHSQDSSGGQMAPSFFLHGHAQALEPEVLGT